MNSENIIHFTRQDSELESEQERRRYFRIEEDIILLCREVEQEDVPEHTCLEEIPDDPFAMSAMLELLTQESRGVLRRFEREQPDIADFLKIMDRKIDLIGRIIMTRETARTEYATQKVNLSASGLAFNTEKPCTPGQVLELKIVLMPSMIGVVAYGRVIDCRKSVEQTSSPYQIAVDFVGLCERDRELLIRHVVKRQLQQLRSRRQTTG